MRALYTALLYLALPLVLARLWWRGRREPGYRAAVGERFGLHRGEVPADLLWIHAVSVGEVRAAEPLVRGLQRLLPEHRVLVTCTTAAGRETVRRTYGEGVLHAWLPYDYPGAVARFLRHFRPRLCVLMETEVWPNLLAACARHDVPVVLANARLSEKSARRYHRFRALAAPAFARLGAVCAQSRADAERLRRLGAPAIEVTGNLKFDVTPDAGQVAAGRAWRAALGRPVLLLASTRDGEEKALLDAAPSLGDALVLIVPRHPQRFDEVAALAQSRRSRAALPGAGDRVHLGDSMGEMPFYYGAADVAVIGGSVQPLGGQNLIEALAVGVPVVAGRFMFNFSEATRLAKRAGAIVQKADARAVMEEAVRLLGDPQARARMGEAGRRLCEEHRGATQRHLRILEKILRARAPAPG